MKKILYSAAAIALAFFAASCQQENLEPAVGGNTVTYTVQVPDAIATKATEDVTKLIYEVYRKAEVDDLAKTPIYEGTADINAEGVATLSLEFVKNQEFTVLFWAQNPNAAVYNTADLRKVTLATGLTANNDALEVFAGIDTVNDCVSAAQGNVPLVRPIAQVNIGTSNESLTIGNTTDITLNKSSLKVTGLSNTYNVATKEVGATEVEYAYSETVVPTGSFPKTDYTYVAMNYVGFASTLGDNIEITLNINTSEGNINHTISNVPVKPNYITNIYGNLITASSNYTVELNKEWAPEHYNVEFVSVSTADDLQKVINESDGDTNIQLEGDIDLGTLAGLISTKTEPTVPTYGLIIPAEKSLVLDLNGSTLSQTVECTATYSMIENRGNLTIIDSKGTGKISFKDTSAGDPNFTWGSYTISNLGTLVVNSGTIEHTGGQNTTNGVVHMYCAIQQNSDNAVTTINGGTIKNDTYRSIRICRGTANISGGEMIGQVWVQPFGEGITLNIAGGSFQPSGADGSSVFVTNDAKAVDFAVTGGFFKTKIGCSVPANLAGTVTGGTFTLSAKENTPADLYQGYKFVADGENFILEQCPVKIGETAYGTLAEAVEAVKEGETITILAGKTLEEGTIKLPATLKNVTFAGEEGAVLKDMTIIAADGSSFSYEGLTFNGITFDNSRISITGWRTGGVTVNNFAVTNCTFENLYDTTSSAPLHINMAATEPVNGLTFTNNVIDGATGGSKSGIYAQVTGEVLVSGNVINNVAFRPYVIQVTTDDGVADNFVVTNNTFSGSAVGRAQGLGSNAEGTDAVNVEVTENVFKGITSSQQICYWNFNPAKTTYDLSHNYYDIDIIENPGKIYFNSAAADMYDLADMKVFPIYTDENKSETYSPEINAAKIGETEYATLQEAFNVGGEITLLCNVTVDETVVLAEGKTATLDLNGKSILSGYQSGSDSKHIYPIDNYGILNIIDKAQGGFIQGRGIYNRDAAKLTINQAKIFAEDWNGGACVWSYGTGEVYLNDATLIGNTGCVSSEGYVEINGGAYTCYSGINDNGEQITSPTYNIRAYNGLKITDGTFTSRHGVISIGGGEALLETGDFTINFTATTTSNVLYVYGDAQVTVNGGNYISDNSNKKADSGAAVLVSGADAKVDIFGGTFIGMNGMVSGNTTLYGGTFNTVWDYNHYDKLADKLAEGYVATQNADGSWTVAPSSTEN